jgi:hypothetical protein
MLLHIPEAKPYNFITCHRFHNNSVGFSIDMQHARLVLHNNNNNNNNNNNTQEILTPQWPVTGKSRLFNSCSIIFHLPTLFSLSIGVTLLSNTQTFGRARRSSFCLRASTNFRGLGGVIRCVSKACAVLEELIAESGIRTPVNCRVRLSTYIE